jgi:hypothetical protein
MYIMLPLDIGVILVGRKSKVTLSLLPQKSVVFV